MLGVRIGTRHEFSIVVYADHQSGSVVKDAFLTGWPLADSIRLMRSEALEDDLPDLADRLFEMEAA